MCFREGTGFEKVETGATGEEFHDDPELIALDKAAIVFCDPLAIALCQVSDLLLNLTDIVVRVFEIDLLDGYDLSCFPCA